MSVASSSVKLDTVLFKNKVTVYIFLIILSGKCPLQILSTGINVLLLSYKVSWVFILVYYMLAACMLI